MNAQTSTDQAEGPTGADEKPKPSADESEHLPRLGFIGWLRFAWRYLTSMRTALWLLLLLVVAAIPGSFLPQRATNIADVDAWKKENPDWGPTLDKLGFFDVYTSVWFSAIYLLLFISLIGCIIPRVLVYAKAWKKPPTSIPRSLARQHGHHYFTTQTSLGDLAENLKKQRFRVVADHDAGTISAERGYLREAGNLLFHVSLVGILISVACSGLFAYSAQTLIPVGQSVVNARSNYDAFSAGAGVDPDNLPLFRTRLDRFDVGYDRSVGTKHFGEPRSFDAQITILEQDGTEKTQELKVNRPVKAHGTELFLAGNGYAPLVTVKDASGDTKFTGAIPFLPFDKNNSSRGVVKVPDIEPKQLGFQAVFLPTAIEGQDGLQSRFPAPDLPELVFFVYTGDLGLDRGSAQSVFRLDMRRLEQLQVASKDKPDTKVPYRGRLRIGDTIELPDGLGSITFDGVKRYVALTVRHDPGKTPALISSAFAVAGLTMSLVLRRRRIWIRTATDNDDTDDLPTGDTNTERPTLNNTSDNAQQHNKADTVETCRYEIGGASDGNDGQLADYVADLPAKLCPDVPTVRKA